VSAKGGYKVFFLLFFLLFHFFLICVNGLIKSILNDAENNPTIVFQSHLVVVHFVGLGKVFFAHLPLENYRDMRELHSWRDIKLESNMNRQ